MSERDTASEKFWGITEEKPGTMQFGIRGSDLGRLYAANRIGEGGTNPSQEALKQWFGTDLALPPRFL